jgi:hypothetical protein
MATAENENHGITTSPTTFVVAKHIFIMLMLAVLAFIIYTIVTTKVNLKYIDILSFLNLFPTPVVSTASRGEVEKTLMDLVKNFKQ